MTPVETDAPLIEISGLTKDYQSLRPLRLRSLIVCAGEVVAISGLDAPAAEAFVHLVTGAMLPDTGDVSLFGQSTRSILDGDAWLTSLDRVGILSTRAVLIEAFTLLQNIAMPFSLAVDPIDPAVEPLARSVAEEAGLTGDQVALAVADAPAEWRLRAHLARALALGPRLLIAEHPSALLPRPAVTPFASDLARVARRRGLAVVVLTEDDAFARALGSRHLALNGATGELSAPGLLRRILGSTVRAGC